MPTSSEAAARPALIRLASEPSLLGQDTDGVRGRQALAFRPSAGRVFAARYADLRSLTEALADNDWAFDPAGTAGLDKAANAASMSLESFYLLGADASRAVLPTPPADDLHLLAWPDLGEAAALEYPLAVADSLLKRDQTAGAIAMATGLSPTDVAVCFWAFRAAGLIQMSSDQEQTADDEGLFAHLFGRLRSRRRGGALAG
jgi:hypothetical protein